MSAQGRSLHVADRQGDGSWCRYRQMRARVVAVSKGRRQGFGGALVSTWRSSSLRGLVGDLLQRRSARDELEPGVTHASAACLATGDDGFVTPQLGHGAEDGAPVAVEEGDEDLDGEQLPGKAGVDSVFGHRGPKACRQTAVGVASAGGETVWFARTGRQCTVVAVGQYSTLRWHISASSSRSW